MLKTGPKYCKGGNVSKCCNDVKNLEWIREGECWPYEVWECFECKTQYNVELIRNFKNKEKR